MPKTELDINPVSHITADAIGQPGQRVFYLQGWKDDQSTPLTVILEKIQLQSLASAVEQLLTQLARQDPDLPPPSAAYDEARMRIHPPVEPLFRVGDIGLGYNPEKDLVAVQVHAIALEGNEPQDADLIRFWCTRQQVLSLALWSREVINRGRPVCPLCGHPVDPEGHFCPKKNGHKKK